MNLRLTTALLAATALGLGACSQQSPSAGASSEAASEAATEESGLVEPAAKSVPAALEDADGLQTVAEGLKETGMASAFEGKGSYTLLAPGDAAFSALGEAGKAVTEADDHAAFAALLKAHVLPGYLTPQDIGAAIDAAKSGEVKMSTLGGDELIFSRSADKKIVVTAPDGSHANLAGDPIAGGSSIAIPVDAVLKKV